MTKQDRLREYKARRKYEKLRNICKDDFGKNIYVGDVVELWIPMEVKSTYKSSVFWSMLMGAMVEGHPTHIKMNGGKMQYRRLSDYLNQSPITLIDNNKGKSRSQTGYCKKVLPYYKNKSFFE